jgi:type IV pilus assembly protein PilX
MHTHFVSSPPRQRGAILVVSLLLLLVMTALALTASQTTRLQERMAGNARDLDLAFQGAETGLRGAEAEIQVKAQAAGMRMVEICTDPTDCIMPRPTSAIDYGDADETWWNANSRSYGDPSVKELDALVTDPIFRSELWSNNLDSLTEGARPGQQTGTAYYVNTSRSVGGTDTAEVLVQSVYASPYVE